MDHGQDREPIVMLYTSIYCTNAHSWYKNAKPSLFRLNFINVINTLNSKNSWMAETSPVSCKVRYKYTLATSSRTHTIILRPHLLLHVTSKSSYQSKPIGHLMAFLPMVPTPSTQPTHWPKSTHRWLESPTLRSNHHRSCFRCFQQFRFLQQSSICS